MIKCSNCGEVKKSEQERCRFCGESGANIKSAAVKVDNSPQEKSEYNKSILSSVKLMNEEALIKTGILFLDGVLEERNLEAASLVFEECAKRGDAEGMFYYAKTLIELGDEDSGLWWMVQSAKLGNIKAQITLAEAFKGEIKNISEEKIVGEQSELKALINRTRRFCVELTCISASNEACSGSGCIISSKYLITNAHVVYCNRTKSIHKDIIVNFAKSLNAPRQYADVVCYDIKEDIAVCKLRDVEINGNTEFLKFVDAHSLECGDKVFTIGNALGHGLALSTGVVSKEVEFNAFGKSEVLQADMCINGGNSGGALFNGNGNIVGLMTFTLNAENNNTRAYGMSYAITSNTVAKFIKANGIEL